MTEELHDKYLRAAQDKYHCEGEIEIDGNATVSQSDDGAYVQAWVWIGKEELD